MTEIEACTNDATEGCIPSSIFWRLWPDMHDKLLDRFMENDFNRFTSKNFAELHKAGAKANRPQVLATAHCTDPGSTCKRWYKQSQSMNFATIQPQPLLQCSSETPAVVPK